MQVMPQLRNFVNGSQRYRNDRLWLSVWYVLNPLKVLIFNTFIASPEYNCRPVFADSMQQPACFLLWLLVSDVI